MRRSALPLVILAVVIVAAVLAWIATERLLGAGSLRSAPAGPVASQTRALDPFTRIDVSGHLDVELRQGDRHEVRLEGAADDLARIATRVADGRLAIARRDGGPARWGHAGKAARLVVTTPALETVALAGTVRLTVPALDVPELRIAASGASEIRVDKLRARSLKLSGSGAVQAELAGEVDEQAISLSGAGDVQAARLASRDARVSVSGAGRVVLQVADKLDVGLSGAGKVEYIGDPEVTQRVSGFGSVKRRSERPDRVRARLQAA